MSDRPSPGAASAVSNAISSLKSVHSSTSTLNEDIKELLEHIQVVEKLPSSTNLGMIDEWRSRLLTKMRMRIAELELDYRQLVDSRWRNLLKVVKGDGPAISGVSFTFANDLRVVDDFFTKAHVIAAKNVLFDSTIRFDVPVLPRQVDLAISRLISDIKSLDAMN
ncbi:hypothetical protein Y032_0464g1937 [Ancylostoma ceylanicum]|uniref:Uncharacterized protein n=1 Tax=Ancylostoma ceylanicum TaxID=53326 RepID=A0A016WXG2_9BILA|nr:hypothetical protein Y032_0464g1937 [Ancylostoma ceylanicum]